MMIKFRAWDKEKKIMNIVDGINFDDGEVWKISYDGAVWRDASDYVLMQTTGLYDKKDKEIYYDDILKCDDGTLLVVDDVRTHSFLDLNMHFGFEVIGNIYENEDLLE